MKNSEIIATIVKRLGDRLRMEVRNDPTSRDKTSVYVYFPRGIRLDFFFKANEEEMEINVSFLRGYDYLLTRDELEEELGHQLAEEESPFCSLEFKGDKYNGDLFFYSLCSKTRKDEFNLEKLNGYIKYILNPSSLMQRFIRIFDF